MSEEIKEILDRIKYIVDNPTYEDVYYEGVNRCVDENPNYTALDSKESKLLLDYITNIQQENQKLEKENKRLNNIINELEIISGNRMNTILEIEKYCNDEKEDLIAGGEVCEDILKIIDELKENK